MTTPALARDINRLIAGRVLDSGDVGYAETIAVDNGRITHEPRLIVVPETAKDVGKVVKYCAAKSVPLSIRSGGHSATGYCLNSDGVVLDMRALRAVNLDSRDPERLVVGAGARWIEVYDFLRERHIKRIAVGGGCPGVGVSGFLLGGGYSFLSRSLGLGCDNVESMDFVGVDGEVYALNGQSKGQEKELFWALRGGGGGNFGVTTKVVVQTHETRPMLMGQILYPFHRLKDVLPVYNRWIMTLPNEMAVYGYIGHQPDPRAAGERVLCLRFTPIFNGEYAEGVRLIQNLVDECAPIGMELYQMTLPEWERFIGNVTLVRGRAAYMKSVIMKPEGLTDAVGELFMKCMARCPSRDTFIVWTHAGGKIRNDVAARSSSFAYRDADLIVELKSIWEATRPELTRLNVDWAFDFFEELGEHGVGSYLNYIDPLLPDWKTKYYGNDANYARLMAVQGHWDPERFFRFQQGIGSDFQPTADKPLDLSPLYRTHHEPLVAGVASARGPRA